VKVTKGDETRTAVFKETIPEWPSDRWYSGNKIRLNLEHIICFRNPMPIHTLSPAKTFQRTHKPAKGQQNHKK